MDYIFWGTIAIKLGKELYDQLQELIGDKVPTWDECAANNAELATMIEAEKNK
jgi:hypothetical protein